MRVSGSGSVSVQWNADCVGDSRDGRGPRGGLSVPKPRRGESAARDGLPRVPHTNSLTPTRSHTRPASRPPGRTEDRLGFAALIEW